jgi:hypothetical protein
MDVVSEIFHSAVGAAGDQGGKHEKDNQTRGCSHYRHRGFSLTLLIDILRPLLWGAWATAGESNDSFTENEGIRIEKAVRNGRRCSLPGKK